MPEPVLPDVLGPGLRIVFCGMAAGNRSAREGVYYAGPGNKFWPTLHRIGLTPYQLDPTEFRSVQRYGVGLTDICKTESGPDGSLSGKGRRQPRREPHHGVFSGDIYSRHVAGLPGG